MSNVSDIYDGLITIVQTVLPDYTQLPDAYFTSGNNDIDMISGFSLGFGEGSNTKREFCRSISIERTFNLRLTRLRAVTDEDVSGRSTEEKQIMDDLFLVADELNKTTTVSGHDITINYETDTGIVLTEDEQHLTINATIVVEYFE